MKPDEILVFPSQLGWMAVVAAGTTVKRLTFGHSTAAAAKTAITKGTGNISAAFPVILSERRLVPQPHSVVTLGAMATLAWPCPAATTCSRKREHGTQCRFQFG